MVHDADSTFFRLYYTNPLVAASSTLITCIGIFKFHHHFIRRLSTVDDLTSRHLNGRRTVSGRVTSVGDADNFRLYHQPMFRFRKTPTTKLELRNQTLHVRLAGVDAPEMAHFGHSAQPYSLEAFQCLKSCVLGRRVTVRLYRKDRYGRVVGMAYVRNFPWVYRTNVSEELLRQGCK